MINRYGWAGLPHAVRSAVCERLGAVPDVREIGYGQNSNVALVARVGGRETFVKGVRGVRPQMRWLRNETQAGKLAPGIAPETRFAVDVDAEGAPWFLGGFEFITGEAANLSPGSPDLPVVAAAVRRLGGLPEVDIAPLAERWASPAWWEKAASAAPGAVEGWDVADMTAWCQLAASSVEGSAILHTDLHEHQFRIQGPTARIIDWGRPASGAAWVDTAFLAIRLIAAGHAPGAAESWAAAIPAWSRRTENAVTAFACYVAGLWTYRHVTAPFPGSGSLARAAQSYARHRLAQ